MPHRLSLKRVGTFVVALLAIMGMALLAPKAARAQNTNSGTVTGQITDAQGAAMVGAVITLTNTATNGAQATIANTAGRYAFVNLQPGTYLLDVKKEGFKEATIKDQLVTVGKTLTLNVPMQVGTATQTVEVSATGAELQTMNSTVGSTISGDAIVKLPNLGRDANALTMLQPNTAPNGGIAGADQDQNSYSLDGGANSDDMDGAHDDYTPSSGGGSTASGVIPTPAESIEQFSVGVSNQTADVNSAAGSSVAMVTKRGSDAVHGSVYEYYLGSYLGANSWANNRTNTAKAKSHQNRFGASLGGEILPNFLGGKTYLFGNFEGRRFPNTATYERSVPSDLLRAGIVSADNGSGTIQHYNLNATNKVVGGVNYLPAVCNLPNPNKLTPAPTGACDPRALGINPVVQQLWKQYMPEPNELLNGQLLGGDQVNSFGYKSSLDESLRSNFFVTRLDHDFGSKSHLTVTYHFYSYNPTTTSQVDIGGATPGATFGKPVSTTQRPELPSMWSAGLTTSVSANVTNSFHYSYLRNFWQWGGADLNPQAITGFSGLGGALELGGESSNALIPYNVNTQNVRSRFWDGIGHTFSDDVSVLKGNHIFQFGGKYTHQWDYHQRNDNGGGILAANVYQIAGGSSVQGVVDDYTPTDFTAKADVNTFANAYNEALGIVSQPQTLYTRAGQQLNLQPLGTPMFDQSYIPLYNVYFSDSWHLKPNLTLTYGSGYTVEMPPHEALGKQVELVDGAGNLVPAKDYLATTQRMALGGQVYNPELGFATVSNIGGGLKYPYKPFYGGISPRLSLAWNPNFNGGVLGAVFGGNKSVIRGGWSRVYGRLNGVDLVLVPLLGTGLGQPVTCIGATSTGNCAGVGGADPLNAFRIGPKASGDDGLVAPLGTAPSATLKQPFFPGVDGPAAGAGEVLDPNFKPNRSDEFDLTIQRQLSSNFSTEVGYTGRVIRNEYQAVNLDAVPYMLTSGGQQFQQAFANIYQSIANGTPVNVQSFFETALSKTPILDPITGKDVSYCAGFTTCTAAVAAKEGPKLGGGNNDINPLQGNDVYSLWSHLNASPSWTLGRTTASSPLANSPSGQLQGIFSNASLGYGNYNALFWTLTMRNFHGLTASSNFTWSRSFGTGQVDQATSQYSVTDPWNMHAMYGPQGNDTPLNYNLFFVYEPGSKTQHGLVGRLANGWSFAPILTWNDGGWATVSNGGNCSSFGEMDCGTGNTLESAIKTVGYTGGSSVSQNVTNTGVGTRSNASSGGTGMNRFGSNAGAIFAEFRPMVLGLDTTGQSGLIPGLGHWNVDFSLTKDLALSERFGTEISAQAANVFNHFAPSAYALNLNNQRNFGAISGDALGARSIEVGLRIHW